MEGRRLEEGHAFLEKLFELSCEFLAHLWLGEVVLEEGEDIFSEGGWFGVASVGRSAVGIGDGEEKERDIGPSVRTSHGLRCCAVDGSKSSIAEIQLEFGRTKD